MRINTKVSTDASTDEDDKFGIEGAMKYFSDLGVKLDEITCIGVAELCKCPAMGEFTREGFVNGWRSVKYVFLPILSILNSDTDRRDGSWHYLIIYTHVPITTLLLTLVLVPRHCKR